MLHISNENLYLVGTRPKISIQRATKRTKVPNKIVHVLHYNWLSEVCFNPLQPTIDVKPKMFYSRLKLGPTSSISSCLIHPNRHTLWPSWPRRLAQASQKVLTRSSASSVRGSRLTIAIETYKKVKNNKDY